MSTHDLALKPFGPRDATPQGMGWLGRLFAVALISGVIGTTSYWAGALVRMDSAQANPWRSDPPVVSLAQSDREALKTVHDHPDALIVLNYHEVSSRAGTQAGGTYAVSPEAFSKQLAALKEAGYQSVRLSDVANFVAGKAPLPPRPVLLAFDDGHSTDLGVADPILAQYGFNAVAFLITASLSPGTSPSYYLSRDEVATLQSSGRWEFGSHTDASHYRKADGSGRQVSALDHRLRKDDGTTETFQEWHDRVDTDLSRSQASLKAQLGAPAAALAYPYNAHGQDDEEMGPGEPAVQTALTGLLRQHGFSLGFAGMPNGVASAVHAGDDPLTLRRMTMRSDLDAAQMLYIMEEMLPTRLDSTATLAWEEVQGTCSKSANGAVQVMATDAKGAQCRPGANSDLWGDYTVSSTLAAFDKRLHPTVTVRDGRDHSAPDRVEVEFGKGTVTVREVIGNEPRAIGVATLSRVGKLPVPFQIKLRGTAVTVVVDGRVVRTAPVQKAGKGGVSLGVAGVVGQPVTWADVRVTR